MSRYIDADEIIKDLTAMKSMYDAIALDGMIKALNEAPTADVVEAPVRCKDCKHNVANWKHDELDATDYTDIVCDYWMSDGLEPDSFCSRGERVTE